MSRVKLMSQLILWKRVEKERRQLHGGRKQKTGKNCSRVHIIGQLIFKDIKFRGLSKISFNKMFREYIFKDKQVAIVDS